MPETAIDKANLIELNLPQRPMQDLALSRDPEAVLTEAHRAAAALKKVIDGKAKKVIFNGEVYLEYEDWQTVAKFYGVTARVREVKYVEYGEVKGFEAFAEAVLVPKDQVISAADAMCLNDEDNWSKRPRYEWHYFLKAGGTAKEAETTEMVWEENPDKPGKKRPKRKKVHVGDDPVPLFQLRSMAQTRACAKALRNAVAWVVVLAGYKPTPAEEMTHATVQEVLFVGGQVIDANTKEAAQAVGEEKIAQLKAEMDARQQAQESSRTETTERDVEQVIQGVLKSISGPKKTRDKGTPFIRIEIGAQEITVWDKKLFEKQGDELPVIGQFFEKPVRAIVKKKGKYLNLVSIEHNDIEVDRGDDPFAQPSDDIPF